MLKALLATDGSGHSLKAVSFLPKCHNIKQLDVTAIYIKDLAPAAIFMDASMGRVATKALEEASNEALSKTIKALKEAGIEAKQRSEIGNPADKIAEIAEREGFDLIICGSRGHGGITGLFLGSVSERLVSRARCPVLIVR